MANESLFPSAVSIAGFRSFGTEPTMIGPLRRLNFIVGQNNSGKSNIIRALTILSSIVGPNPRYALRPPDFNNSVSPISITLYFPLGILKEQWLPRVRGKSSLAEALVSNMDGTALFPYPFSLNQNSEHKVTTRDVEDFAESLQLNDRQLGELSLQVFGSAGSRSQNAQNLLRQFDGGAYIGNKVLLIPQLRSVHGINQYTANADPFLGKDKPYCFSGERLIDLLFELQHPPLEKQSDKRKLQSITNLMRHITDNQTISIEIPHDKSSILIEMDGKILPLHNLGSGIEELLIMGAASISFENRIICIEEPELELCAEVGDGMKG